MSHSTSNASPHSTAQIPWQPIPSGELSMSFDEHRRTEESTLVEAAPQDAVEQEALLNDPASASRDRSISSTSSRLSTDEVQVKRPEAFDRQSFEHTRRHGCKLWIPYTLRRSFLAPLGLSALTLAIILGILSDHSKRHYGLGAEDGTVGLFFARRYVPTIIAVLVTLAITMIAEDVKRTEPFARMASPQPPTAAFTLFYIPKVWWKSVFEALSTRRNGGRRRWILSFSSLAAGISVLVISTLSSSVFVTKELLLRTELQLQRYTPQQNGSIVLLPRRDTYTRVISGFLYNVSTSPWVSDNRVILPFITPSESTGPRLREGTWEAETMVLQTESTCTTMSVIEKTDLNITFSSTNSPANGRNGTFRKASRGLKLRSEDGCEVQLQTPITPSFQEDGFTIIDNPIGPYFTDNLALNGGMMWTNLSSSHVSWQNLIDEHGQTPTIDSSESAVLDQWRRTFIYGMSEQCQGRDLIFVSPPWFGPRIVGEAWSSQEEYWANFTARAEVCTPKYSLAHVPVTAVIGDAGSRVFFDEGEFETRKQPLLENVLDLGRLDELTFGQAWLKYLSTPGGVQEIQGFGGISMLLARTYSLELESLLHNDSLPLRASRLRSRFFTELVASSVLDADVPVKEDIIGKSIKAENRIVVVLGVAISLAVLLFLAACYAFAMLWFASGHRRPLNLDSDPAAIAGIVPLNNIKSPLAAALRTWAGHDRGVIRTELGTRVYDFHGGIVNQQNGVVVSNSDEKSVVSDAKRSRWPFKHKANDQSKRDWRPVMLRKTWLSLIFLGIVAVAIALLVLRHFADRDALFQTAFVQQINLSAFHASFSPHSIIATLIAVVIGLFWDSIDKSMRTLQPYLALSRQPLESSKGISVSYESSYWIWTAFKAARVKHWLLCLVAVGTTLSQILIISMAAIFERHNAIRDLSTDADTLVTIHLGQIRQEPFEFRIDLGSRPFYLTDSLLGTSEADWLYNALDDVTLGTSLLPWTKDEWVFTPVNVSDRNDPFKLFVASAPQMETLSDAAYVTSLFNVSLATSALRSRLECEPVDFDRSDWLDDVRDVYKNRFDQSVTGYVLPTTLSTNENFTAPVFTVPRRMACCANNTDNNSLSVVAYWSSDNRIQDMRPVGVDDEAVDPEGPADVAVSSGWSNTFAIKWIVGKAASTLIPGTEPNVVSANFGHANESVLYYIEEPEISSLKCTPIIEQVNASITLARDSNLVLHYELLGTPQPALGAWDYVYDVVYDSPMSNRSQGNVSFGTYFLSQMLTAPNIIEPAYSSSMMVANHTIENLGAERFALRDTDKGTNMDYMSYANFVLADKDATALLNTTTLHRYSEQTFQTFFKRFATTGNWTYGGPFSVSRAVYEESAFDVTSGKFNGTITERIEVLAMSRVATWISLAILFLLMIILIVLIVALRVIHPPSSMLRNIECLADSLAMVAGSDELARLIDDVGPEGMEKSGIKTRLGWFKDKRGVTRWGVEVVNESVEWVVAARS